MKRVVIIIDKWKLPVFRRHLDATDWAWTTHNGPTHDTLTLKVKVDLVAPLQKVVEAAQAECAAGRTDGQA